MFIYFLSLWISIKCKTPHLDTIKFPVITLINQDNKVTFIRVYEYGALAISSEFMKTCHDMNIVVQATGVNASSLNGKSESTNKTLEILP